MARRGRFGKRPRAAADLTATILAMAREYQNMRENNMLSSWEKGGKFEGKQVTDGMLLDFLKTRRDGFANDDPKWDEYNQRLDQYTFAVENSKQELRYAEGKVGDAAMAGFYRKWAGKLPVNSEAYRKMMMLAAQYKDRANAGGRGGGGGGRSSKEMQYQINKAKAEAKGLAYDTLESVVNDLAHGIGLLNTAKEDISDLRVAEGDGSLMVALMDALNKGTAIGGYSAEQMKNIHDGVDAYLTENSPGWNHDMSFTGFQNAWAGKRTSLTQMFGLASAAGKKGDATKARDDLAKEAGKFNIATAAPLLSQYEEAHKQFEMTTRDPNATPLDIFFAMQKYQSDIGDIAGKLPPVVVGPMGVPGGTQLETLRGHLVSEWRALNGEEVNEPTLWDDSRTDVAAYKQEGGTTSNLSTAVNNIQDQMEKLITGEGVIVRVDETGQPTDDPDGSYGVVPTAVLQGQQGITYVPAGGAGPTTAVIDGKSYSITGVLTATKGTPVYVTGVTGVRDVTGQMANEPSATPKSQTNVGYVNVMPDGTSIFQYWDAGGTKRFTTANPFVNAEGTALKQDLTANGISVSLEVGTQKGKYDPQEAVGSLFRNPETADAMAASVYRSSFAAWLSSPTAKGSQMAFVADPVAANEAVRKEVLDGGGNVKDLYEASREVDRARADFLNNTPDSEKRLRAASERYFHPSLADQTGIEERDPVDDAYDRLVRDFVAQEKIGGGAPGAISGRSHDEVNDIVGQQFRKEQADAMRGVGREEMLFLTERGRQARGLAAGIPTPPKTGKIGNQPFTWAMRGVTNGTAVAALTNQVGYDVSRLVYRVPGSPTQPRYNPITGQPVAPKPPPPKPPPPPAGPPPQPVYSPLPGYKPPPLPGLPPPAYVPPGGAPQPS